MKKMAVLILLALAVSLTACTTQPKQEPVKVKCPACGYEFEAPPYGR